MSKHVFLKSKYQRTHKKGCAQTEVYAINNNLNVVFYNSGNLPVLISCTFIVVEDIILLLFPALYAADCKAVYFNTTAFRNYITLITIVT
jgi:hypothetical protein